MGQKTGMLQNSKKVHIKLMMVAFVELNLQKQLGMNTLCQAQTREQTKIWILEDDEWRAWTLRWTK